MTECIITSVESNASYFQPVIANFQNGELQPDQVDKLQCLAFQNKKSKVRVMTTATENMTYTGTEQGSDDSCYTLLTIKNKRTNKVRIIPVMNVSLNAVLTKMNTALDSTLDITKGSVAVLSKQFGSKRDKRRTEQMERMTMNVSNVEKELEEIVSTIKINPEELVIPADELEKFYKPTMNPDASTVDKVYDINTIITQQELDTLEELANAVIENPIEDDKYSEFVKEYMNEVKKQDSKNKLQKIELLLYIDVIIKFSKLPFKSIGRSIPDISPYPETIRGKVYNEFTILVNGRRNRPLSMKDKATCYCIVIALIVLDYQFNLELLHKSLGIGLKKLNEVCKILGAQNANKSKNHVILKLPLPAMPSMMSRKKKRK